MTQYIHGALGYAFLISDKESILGCEFYKEVTDEQAKTLRSKWPDRRVHHIEIAELLESK